ncbi:BrnT family toxin [Candidatus Roizmanbacteria bacterium]|nr:BrnT family toxin [Candidatus Roizmanbacteria bacterium]
MVILKEPVEFEWNKGNIGKNLKKHSVTDKEAEEVFECARKFIFKDEKHSLGERRYMIWGITRRGRKLTVFFTLREEKVRIISARDMSRKERREYEEKIQINTKI